MIRAVCFSALFALMAGVCALYPPAARADGSIQQVNHIIIVMQENHSFDNYFGALPYTGTGYHPGPCLPTDHRCVDGLTCRRSPSGNLICTNSNPEADGSTVFSFHDLNYCPAPDLDHGWTSSHLEANFSDPNNTLVSSPNDGFVRVNDLTEQIDTTESPTEDDTMGYYTDADLPFYYQLARLFAIDDSYHAPLIGPTIPNRFYLMAATSFGHLLTLPDAFLSPFGAVYHPITGTIFDLLDAANVSWTDYFSDDPQAGDFRFPLLPPTFTTLAPHFEPVTAFFAEAAAGTLPAVSFVDPQLISSSVLATDEHPPHDIRSGEFFVAQILNAVRNSPNWKDSIVLLTYDEHGGFYDHVAPPPASQAGALNPDGIDPGLCEDASNPPTSEQPGGGVNCTASFHEAQALCPSLPAGGPYPASCANFNQLGFRVPFLAISPFSKTHYVSHTVGDHTSVLALIEARFLNGESLTARDANANPLLDMFDFDDSPSLDTPVPAGLAPPPNLCTDGNGFCATLAGVPCP
jgi:phospholipase C